MSTVTLERQSGRVDGKSLIAQPLVIHISEGEEQSFFERLCEMGYARRLAMYRRGDFSRSQRSIWAARFPEEVPLLNGEFEWIALAMADLD